MIFRKLQKKQKAIKKTKTKQTNKQTNKNKPGTKFLINSFLIKNTYILSSEY